MYQKILGNASQATVKAHIIIYGVRGWIDSVDPGVYDDIIHYLDDIFEDDNGMKMKTNINLNNHQIKNLTDGINDADAVNKLQLDTVSHRSDALSYYTNSYVHRLIFGDDFYDFINTSRFVLSQTASGVVIEKVSPNFDLGKNRFVNYYDPKYGLKLSRHSHIKTSKTSNQDTSFTFFMSFKHDTSTSHLCLIYFRDSQNSNRYYPRYSIKNNEIAIINPWNTEFDSPIVNDLQNKQLFIWICLDHTQNLYKDNFHQIIHQIIFRLVILKFFKLCTLIR